MNREITLLLPSTGEPLLLYCFLQNFKKYQHLISNSFISVDTMGFLNEMEFIFIQNYLKRQFSKVSNLRYHFNSAIGQHGFNINSLLSTYEPDIKENILLMEEDDLILNVNKLKFEIEDHFNENYDITGVGRGACTPTLSKLIGEYVKSRSNLYINTKFESHENYFNFWPTLFLTKKKHLLNSSRTFNSYQWHQGTIFKIGDKEWKIEETCHGDTFVKFSIELYENQEIKKVKLIYDTYHSRIEDDKLIPDIINTSVDFHVGSLSTLLINRFWNPLLTEWLENTFVGYMRRLKDKEHGRNEIVEIYRRCCLLRQMLYSIKDPNDFEFYKNYEKNINDTINIFEKENNIPEVLKQFGVESPSLISNCHKIVFDKIYE